MKIQKIATTYILPVIALLVLSTVFFYPQVQGKKLTSHDITAFKGMVHEINEYREETGKTSWWTNSMFGGMPAYQISSRQDSSLFKYVDKAMHFFVPRPIGLFFLIMLCAYISLLLFKSPPWVAFFGAAVIGLSVSNFLLYGAGHMTKVKTVGYCIPIFMGIYLAYNKNRWGGMALYGIALGLALFSNHPQMLYYMGLSLVVFGIISLVDAIKNSTLKDFGITTAGLLIISLIALASSASKIMPTLEYAKDTMRGEPLLTITSNADSKSSEVSGLDWEYATGWSNGWLDVFAGLVPGAAGGASGEKAPSGSQTIKNMKSKGYAVNADTKLPLYWGAMASTGGAFYFGAVLLFFMFLQFFIGDKKLSIWLAVTLFLMMLMSMGRNMEGFNHFLFDNLPYLNKFRAPNSISAVMTAIVGLGGAFGLHALVTTSMDKKELTKKIIFAAAPLAAICLFFVLLGPSMFDFDGMSDARYTQSGFDVNDLRADRKKLMQMDALRSLLFIALAAGSALAYGNYKIKQSIAILIITVLAVVDNTGIGRRYLSNDDFVSARKVKSENVQRPVDQQILQMEKERGAYRVLDQSVNTYTSAQTSYWHNTVGGYHPAKLQRFEDIKNFHLYKGNQAVFDMMNTKYIINRDQKVQQNPGALGNAWFVKEIKTVGSNDEEIQALTGFNPAQTAIVHADFNDAISGLQPTGVGTIALKSYAPDKLVYTSKSGSEELVVFSEVWYGPNKGWEVSIDGQPAELIRANYLLRALRLPAGDHEIVMTFDPATVRIGNTLTLIASILLLAFAGYLIFRFFKNNPINIAEEKTEPKIQKKAELKKKGK